MKGAPFGLTAQAIKAVLQWEFKAAQKMTAHRSPWPSRSKSLTVCFESSLEKIWKGLEGEFFLPNRIEDSGRDFT
jgi:hypothetical protein